MNVPDHPQALSRARRSLLGLSIGDAFGENFFAEESAAAIPKRRLPRPPWRYTDDTAMALSIVEVLSAHQGIEPDALAAAFGRRFTEEPWRGYGFGAQLLLQAISEGLDWREGARKLFDGEGSFGNGGAMRAAPIGAYFAGDPAAAAEHAQISAKVTHSHPEGQAGAIAVAVATSWAAHWPAGAWSHSDPDPDSGPNPNPNELFDVVAEHLSSGGTRDGILQAQLLPLEETPKHAADLLGSGARVSSQDTVPFTIWCIARHLGQFEDGLWAAVSGGGDVDTTAAIVGGALILTSEESSIPKEWIAATESLPAE